MDEKEVRQTVVEFCEASFVEVFQNQGCLVYRSPDDIRLSADQMVTIDARADELELVMVLAIPRAVLSESYPSSDQIVGLEDGHLLDWYKELANRLMGSLKNRLIVGTSPMTLGIPDELEKVGIADEFGQETLIFELDGISFGCILATKVLGTINSLEQAEVDTMDGELELF